MSDALVYKCDVFIFISPICDARLHRSAWMARNFLIDETSSCERFGQEIGQYHMNDRQDRELPLGSGTRVYIRGFLESGFFRFLYIQHPIPYMIGNKALVPLIQVTL